MCKMSYVEVFVSNRLQKCYGSTSPSITAFEIQRVLPLLSELSIGDRSKITNQRPHAHSKCGEMLTTITQTKQSQKYAVVRSGSPNLSAKGSTDLQATFTGYRIGPVNITEILTDPVILFMDVAGWTCLVLLTHKLPTWVCQPPGSICFIELTTNFWKTCLRQRQCIVSQFHSSNSSRRVNINILSWVLPFSLLSIEQRYLLFLNQPEFRLHPEQTKLFPLITPGFWSGQSHRIWQLKTTHILSH